MSVKLTKKQTQILGFISNFLDTHNYAPSYREIAAGLGLRSPASVAEHIDNLVAIGALKKNPKSPRSLEVVDLTFPETTALFESRLRTATPEEKEILTSAATILGLDLPNSSPPVL
ncbi:hypothetical protein IJ096_00365 [Candidatus Saccharibacteria bacterium]|nr:hypothetical protein [Candidatus Saccharibacteria bacterium]